MHWHACPPDPLSWFAWRDALLSLLLNPALLLPMAGAVALLLARWLQLSRLACLALVLLSPLALSALYSSATTAWLSGWLLAQLPPAPPASSAPPVAVLVGRGPEVAAATSDLAAQRLRNGLARAVYVSGDERATAERLERLRVPPALVAGDSCARTTWENATLTAAWLHQHHPGVPVLLITDPWQLSRAARAFARQGVLVQPLAAEPLLDPSARNRLALRESAATALYWLQGRL
jgi:uncharacterized SAM-binding protein YcdF (DUF218 family)